MGNAGFVRGTYHQIGHVGKHGESRLLSKVFLKHTGCFRGSGPRSGFCSRADVLEGITCSVDLADMCIQWLDSMSHSRQKRSLFESRYICNSRVYLSLSTSLPRTIASTQFS